VGPLIVGPLDDDGSLRAVGRSECRDVLAVLDDDRMERP